jgi:hypothetical protein
MSTPREATAATSTAIDRLWVRFDARLRRHAVRSALLHCRVGLLLPREHNKILTVSGRHEDPPPFIWDSTRRDRRAGATTLPEWGSRRCRAIPPHRGMTHWGSRTHER